MNILQKIKILLKINTAYEKVTAEIKREVKMDNKKWYLSKTVWGIVISSAIGIIQAVNPELLGTPIATAVIAVATALGIYGRAKAETPLK